MGCGVWGAGFRVCLWFWLVMRLSLAASSIASIVAGSSCAHATHAHQLTDLAQAQAQGRGRERREGSRTCAPCAHHPLAGAENAPRVWQMTVPDRVCAGEMSASRRVCSRNSTAPHPWRSKTCPSSNTPPPPGSGGAPCLLGVSALPFARGEGGQTLRTNLMATSFIVSKSLPPNTCPENSG